MTLAHVLLAAALAAGNEPLQFDFGVPGSVIGEQIGWQWIDSARWQVVAVVGMCKMAGA